MEIKENQIFNLMDTNGRRNDIINAYKVYLEILRDLSLSHPQENWGTYPKSTKQFLFYEEAIERSSDVFQQHKIYDEFVEALGSERELFLAKKFTPSSQLIVNKKPFLTSLDEAIESRARHYTSNLVKLGLADSERNITETGASFLNNHIERDSLEGLLPLDDINILLIRQLIKLKIFSKPDENGIRSFYSPFLMAMYLLLKKENIDKKDFAVIVQSLSPYTSEAVKGEIINKTASKKLLLSSSIPEYEAIPEEVENNSISDFNVFKTIFTSSKDAEVTSQKYYDFYSLLSDFKENKIEDTYAELLSNYLENKEIINKAFGFGSNVFEIGTRAKPLAFEEFNTANENHVFLTTQELNIEFYFAYLTSKRADGIKEYSDTTLRLLSATGIFKFSKLPSLEYDSIFEIIFDELQLENKIFGSMSEVDYLSYEVEPECIFHKNFSILNILRCIEIQQEAIQTQISTLLGVSTAQEAQSSLKSKKDDDFTKYIQEQYPKTKIIDLLKLFSDRTNDKVIKETVSETATVPTIYEYIVAIAWHYLSNCNYSLYDSLNLTLNADFEPVFHAGGGIGDIIISYTDKVIMLEVTLMNKQAQKRGEWEPVLRHSLNLKADNLDKETTTFFIADELDTNTINIWRAVAAVPLESTTTHTAVEGVIIMPFDNSNIISFLENEVSADDIIIKTKESFDLIPKITDDNWRNEIIGQLLTSGMN